MRFSRTMHHAAVISMPVWDGRTFCKLTHISVCKAAHSYIAMHQSSVAIPVSLSMSFYNNAALLPLEQGRDMEEGAKMGEGEGENSQDGDQKLS